MMMSYFQKCGHTPIILVGGGTAFIGDPSGKTDMRKMLNSEEISKNVDKNNKTSKQIYNHLKVKMEQ